MRRRTRQSHSSISGDKKPQAWAASGVIAEEGFCASAYPQLWSTFLRTRKITAKVPPTITVNRYASQNIILSFASWRPATASPMSAQPKSAHEQEDAGQDPATDAAPE